MDIVLDHGNGNELYALEKSTNDTFYVVKKNTQINDENTVSEITNIKGPDIYDSEDSLTSKNNSTLMLPNFWVILKIQEDQHTGQKNNKSDNNITVNTLFINMYFYCR